jgi:hypothetical protein
MPAPQPTPAVLARALDADARIVCLPPPPARLPRPPGNPETPPHGSRVLAFPGRASHTAFSAAYSPAASGVATPRFTTADRLELLAWQNRGASGYARVLIEDGQPGTLPDCAAYALVYRAGTPWACWGLTRRRGAVPGIMAWRCSTGAKLGLYATMEEALLALPSAGWDDMT